MLATVNSSATTARHPDVPNLIDVFIAFSTSYKFGSSELHTALTASGTASSDHLEQSSPRR
jgi:hypothetical protein